MGFHPLDKNLAEIVESKTMHQKSLITKTERKF